MPAEEVSPLRIQKHASMPSSAKLNGNGPYRPLSEISPMERRRNSPSFLQPSKMSNSVGDNSPFLSSPFNISETTASPRLFWQGKSSSLNTQSNAENSFISSRESSPSPTRRSSIENLKKASRVKNSNMFAREAKQEYDPASLPSIERPLAGGRPLSVQVQGNAFMGHGVQGLRMDLNNRAPLFERPGAKGTRTTENSPTRLPLKMAGFISQPASPSKGRESPTKSSLSSRTRFNGFNRTFDPESGTWSDEDTDGERELPSGKSLHRHAKSVTFDTAPPEINEYEMATPDISSIASGSREGSYESVEDEEGEEDLSFDRGSLNDVDDSFDASLEDLSKTPILGPDDWRCMSLDNSSFEHSDLLTSEAGSPMPEANPNASHALQTSHHRTDSSNSSGERRPLPPVPGRATEESNQSRLNTFSQASPLSERRGSVQRTLPSPPAPALISKAELQGMEGGRMPLEERLRLMAIKDEENGKSLAELQRERRMRRAGSRDRDQSLELQNNTQKPAEFKLHDDKPEDEPEAVAEAQNQHRFSQHISGETLLQKMKRQGKEYEEPDESFVSSDPSPTPTPERTHPARLDPDVPIPSTETVISTETFEMDTSIVIKTEEEEDEIDVYSIPEMYQFEASPTPEDEFIGEESVIRHPREEHDDDDDDGSRYSSQSPIDGNIPAQSNNDVSEDDIATPTPRSPARPEVITENIEENRMSLPDFTSVLGDNDFGLSLQSYMTPPPPTEEEIKEEEPKQIDSIPNMAAAREFLRRPVTPEHQSFSFSTQEDFYTPKDVPGTPESIIHNPVERESTPPVDSPVIPEHVASIKAPGGRLKTRPSATPADMAAMAAARRQISSEHKTIEVAPPIPERHRNRPSLTGLEGIDLDGGRSPTKHQYSSSTGSDLLRLEVPEAVLGGELSFGMDEAFDRAIASSKRGYLMRQNTKVIVASSNDTDLSHGATEAREFRGVRSAGNSPVKASFDKTKSWSVEPWNSGPRRRSGRDSSLKKKPVPGPAPPLPGKDSAVTEALGTVAESEPAADEDDNTERGRVFVKVVSVKDLDLPLPKDERTWFCLTLDNGLHCVTTAWLELGKNAPIGQEFELVVLNDLEFQLTLQTKIEEPPPKPVVHASPTKPTKTHKPSTFSRVFTSPRKRKELEKKQLEDDQRYAREQQQHALAVAQANRASANPTAWDLLHKLVAKDGSFARSYVCLKDHESRAYGRPYTVDIACFNEWATESNPSLSSVKSKRGPDNIQRKAPYRIGKLELQLLFVPKPKGAKDNDMPSSMSACVRELKEAEANAVRKWEGFLSQQGGDCPFWRRRYFKLEGTKFTAYHESTLQPRATINLAKASKLIDDRSALIQKETSKKGGGRRRSAFAEDEEGYMFVEEGFRIRFANGEVIDFYAESAAAKEEWMKVLSETVGKENIGGNKWTDMVLERERSLSEKAKKLPAPAKRAPGRQVPLPPTPAERLTKLTSDNRPRSMIF
ncbi:MAG: Bud site selection protein bud4 [Trizodia sp. TS-e1964]|nr:MAG: Bud site selection protein bud4 [Trizodia sp. TS-e1964]